MKTNGIYIIAEAGVNHNRSLNLAREMVKVAAHSGADAVKFQTFKAERVVSIYAPKAKYQLWTTGNKETQLEMVKKLELNELEHWELVKECKARGIEFISTPFDLDSLDLLVGLQVSRIKISSGDLTNAPLLLKAAQTQKRIILSTGMSTLDEVKNALGVLAFGYLFPKNSTPLSHLFNKTFDSEEGQACLKDKVSLLHCTTEYPAPFGDVNLRAMDTLESAFKLPVGYSDHTTGIAISIAAAARGASIIEKHFTLDRDLPGPDHKASIEPDELEAMISAIRQVEQALGSSRKEPASSELPNRAIARRSLVALERIAKGEIFTERNMGVKRPGTGIPAFYYYNWLGRIASRDYQPDELLEEI